MTQKQTLEILKQHFGNAVQPYKDDVVRCQKSFHDKPYQVFYFDMTDKWLELIDDAKNLEQYIESKLQQDYYNNAGYLQWNYYYVFISGNQKIEQNIDKKRQIEKDELYARKYIMTLVQLEEWLKRSESIGKSTSADIKKDLGAEWINILKEAKLDAVFLDTKYIDGVESYLKGEPILELEETITDDEKSEVDVIRNIKKLKLKNYRPYPLKREFEFGKVNLIEGINGCGKTSILEAIELLLCGATNRNFYRDESKNDLHAVINDGTKEISFSRKNYLLKERDKLWYNNISAKNVRSKIYERFNKFNFFNSDTAYKLSYGTQPEILQAFENLAMGDQVNWLEDRLNKFNDRFQKKLNKYSLIINESQNELNEQKELLKEIGEIDDQPERLLEGLTAEAKLANLIIPAKTGDIVTQFEKDITSAKYYIENINSDINWFDDINQDKVEKEHKRLKKTRDDIVKIKQKVREDKLHIETDEIKYKDLEGIIQLLYLVERYFKDEKIDQLEGLTGKVTDSTNQVNKLQKIKKAMNEVDQEKNVEVKESLKEYESKMKSEIEVVEIKTKKIEKEIKEEKNNLSQLEKIVTEIKAKGKEFIKLQEDATECPLCHTIHPKGVLLQLIEEVKEEFLNTEGHKRLLEQRADLTKKRETLKTNETNFSKLMGSLYILYGDERFESKSIINVLKDLRNAVNPLNKLKKLLARLKNTQLYFKEKGLDEEEFIKLKVQLASKNVEINQDYDKVTEEYEDKLKVLNRKIEINQIDIEDLEKNINKILEEAGIIEGTDEVLNDRIEKAQAAIENYKEMSRIISLDPKTVLTTIERDVNRISALFERYKELKKKKKENELKINSSNKKIKELQKEIKSNIPLEENAKKACDAINDILENHSKSEFLKDFIEGNKDDIVDIFKAIHAPKEFGNVLLDRGKISLKRVNSNDSVELTEISSGQRSALALSIFLALNQKLKYGPNILLFDEPVPTIDDLNILLFLDYLRELVTGSNRQVFFATANENLAYLFKKKFGFLEDDELIDIILDR